MSKYCRKCQHLLADHARFCEKCGTDQTPNEAAQTTVFPPEAPPAPPTVLPPAAPPVEPPVVPPAWPTSPSPTTSSAPQKSKKGFLIGGIVAALAVIALVVVLIFSLGGSGGSGKKSSGSSADPIESILNIHVKIASTGNATNLERIAPDECWQMLEEDSDYTVQEYGELLEDSYNEEAREDLEDLFGENYKFSYEITRETDMDEDDFEDLAEELADVNEIDVDKITEGKELKVKFTVEGSEDKESFSNTIYAVKIDGQWYLVTEGGSFEIFFLIVNQVL